MGMSGNAWSAEDDVLETVREDDLADLTAQLREEAEFDGAGTREMVLPWLVSD
jgi:sirohydrochlorin ferrochelatase